MEGYLEVKGLFKKFGRYTAVDHVSFGVSKAGFLTLLGPSGCGKTTILRCIAGLTDPDDGEIFIEGECIFSKKQGIATPPEKRILGMVFQSYALWPHKTVFQNVAYPLKARKSPRKEIASRVEKCLEMVGLSGLEGRYPDKLSGGQQQRVAVARALAFNPRVLLFDEPLSNLDAKLRERTRLELKRLQQEIGITAVYVTHDQAEAMTISQSVIVMREGRIVQKGSPLEIYRKPVDDFVADFIGITNLIEAEIVSVAEENGGAGRIEFAREYGRHALSAYVTPGLRSGDRVIACVRPENIEVSIEGEEGINSFTGVISDLVNLGNIGDARIRIGERRIRVQVPWTFVAKPGQEVTLRVRPEYCLLLPAKLARSGPPG